MFFSFKKHYPTHKIYVATGNEKVSKHWYTQLRGPVDQLKHINSWIMKPKAEIVVLPNTHPRWWECITNIFFFLRDFIFKKTLFKKLFNNSWKLFNILVLTCLLPKVGREVHAEGVDGELDGSEGHAGPQGGDNTPPQAQCPLLAHHLLPNIRPPTVLKHNNSL